MTPGVQDVTVIIPTLALAEREVSLFRAIESVLGQENIRATPVVSVNGTWKDRRLLARLHADSRIGVIEHEKTGIPVALRAGREVVDTSWFGTLDDDDYLLTGALLTRGSCFIELSDCDHVYNIGYWREEK